MTLQLKIKQAGKQPLDPETENLIEEYIKGFREVMKKITVDEFLKHSTIYYKKFDEYFGFKFPAIKEEVIEPL